MGWSILGLTLAQPTLGIKFQYSGWAWISKYGPIKYLDGAWINDRKIEDWPSKRYSKIQNE